MKFLSANLQDAQTIHPAVNGGGVSSLDFTPTCCRIVIFFVRFISPGDGVVLFMYPTRVLIYYKYAVLCAFAFICGLFVNSNKHNKPY